MAAARRSPGGKVPSGGPGPAPEPAGSVVEAGDDRDRDLADDFTRTARSLVVSRLREEVLSGRLPYGERLLQADVAARFRVSTTPVREAFRELATLGLVQILPHRGAVVTRPSSEELAEIYHVRTLVEPVSIAWAAERRPQAAVEQARKLLAEMRTPANADVSAQLNRRFHALLARSCGNDHLAELVLNLLDLSTPYIVRVLQHDQGQLTRQAAEHEDILEACERGDPARAYAASLRHLTSLHVDGRVDGELPPFPTRWLPMNLKKWLKETTR